MFYYFIDFGLILFPVVGVGGCVLDTGATENRRRGWLPCVPCLSLFLAFRVRIVIVIILVSSSTVDDDNIIEHLAPLTAGSRSCLINTLRRRSAVVVDGWGCCWWCYYYDPISYSC